MNWLALCIKSEFENLCNYWKNWNFRKILMGFGFVYFKNYQNGRFFFWFIIALTLLHLLYYIIRYFVFKLKCIFYIFDRNLIFLFLVCVLQVENCPLVLRFDRFLMHFWPWFYIVVLGIIFFSISVQFLTIFNLHFGISVLLGFLFHFFIWSFVYLLCLDFYNIYFYARIILFSYFPKQGILQKWGRNWNWQYARWRTYKTSQAQWWFGCHRWCRRGQPCRMRQIALGLLKGQRITGMYFLSSTVAIG